MKTLKVAALFMAAGSVASAQTITHQRVNPNVVTPVATALNHISLIELPEPITRAAIGSEDFRIEWHGNTVALRPAKQGVPTNLFVWTEHTQSTYEILPPGDVKAAAFVIDQTESKSLETKSAEVEIKKVSEAEIQKATDLLVAETLLNSTIVNNRSMKDGRDGITVKIVEVVRNHDGLYVRYTVANTGQHPYRVSDPTVSRFTPVAGGTVIAGWKGTQVPEHKVAGLGSGTTIGISVSETRIDNRDLSPGQTAAGIVCIRDSEEKPQLYRFNFANDENRAVGAAAVL